MRLFLRLCLIPLWYSCVLAAQQPAAPPQPLTVARATPVLIRSGSALVHFTLTNSSAAAVPLALSFGPLADTTSGILLPAPKASFKLEAGDADLPAAIGPSESFDILARLSDITGISSASLKLFNRAVPVAEWAAVALDEPLNLTLAGNGTADKPIEMVWRNEAGISLKNSSSAFLTFQWTFGVDGGRGFAQKTLSMAPGVTARISIVPPAEAFSWPDFITPSPHAGYLNLRMVVPAGIKPDLAPQRDMPVALRMSGFSSLAITIVSYAYVGLFLLLGGVLSLLASAVLPNVLTKIDLRKQVSLLANRTSSVSTRVDSYLRVLLRLERKKIDVLLQNIHPYAPTAPDDLAEAAAAIAGLLKRLVIAERLDGLDRRFEDLCSTAPPSLSDAIDKALNSAAFQLHAFVLADADVTAATALLDKADNLIGMLDDKDAVARVIAANFSQLKARLTQFPQDYYKDLKLALPGIFAILDSPFDDPRNIVAPMFFAVDHAIAAIQTALDYAMVRISIPVPGSTNCTQPGTDPRKRLIELECRLLAMLGNLSWRSLSAATNLVQQMREDIYENDVIEQLKAARAHIVFDTQRARPYLPVFFSVSFDDRRFNGAAALENNVIRWTFPGPLEEYGWKVCHYFQGDEPGATRKVKKRRWGRKQTESHASHGHEQGITPAVSPDTLSPTREATNPALPQGTPPLQKGIAIWFDAFDSSGTHQYACHGSIEVKAAPPRRERSRFWAGTLRFSIAFGVALAGLESGGLDQLTKLGFIQATIAIVALGFGADSLKNLLTQSTKPAAVAAAPPKPAH